MNFNSTTITQKISNEIILEYESHIQDLTDEVLQQEINSRLGSFIKTERPELQLDWDNFQKEIENDNNDSDSNSNNIDSNNINDGNNINIISSNSSKTTITTNNNNKLKTSSRTNNISINNNNNNVIKDLEEMDDFDFSIENNSDDDERILKRKDISVSSKPKKEIFDLEDIDMESSSSSFSSGDGSSIGSNSSNNNSTTNLEDINLIDTDNNNSDTTTTNTTTTEEDSPSEPFLQSSFPSLNKGIRANIKDTFMNIKESLLLGGENLSIGERLAIITLLVLPALIGGILLYWFWIILLVLWQVYNLLQKAIDFLKKNQDKIKNKISSHWNKIKASFSGGNFFNMLFSTSLFSVIFFNGIMYLCLKGMMVPLQSMAQLNRFISNLSAKTVNLIANISKGPIAMVKRSMNNMLGFNSLKGKEVVKTKGKAKQNMKLQALKKQLQSLKRKQQQKKQIQTKVVEKKQEQTVKKEKERQSKIIKEVKNIKNNIVEKVKEEKLNIKTQEILRDKGFNILNTVEKGQQGGNNINAKLNMSDMAQLKGTGLTNSGSEILGSPKNAVGFGGIAKDIENHVNRHVSKDEKSDGHENKDASKPGPYRGIRNRIEETQTAKEKSAADDLAKLSSSGVSSKDIIANINNGRDSDPPKSYGEIARENGIPIGTPEEQFQAALHMANIRDSQENKNDNLHRLDEWARANPELSGNELAITSERIKIANDDATRENESFKNNFGFDLQKEIDSYKRDNGITGKMKDDEFKDFVISTAEKHTEISDKVGMMEAMHEQNMAYKEEQRMKDRQNDLKQQQQERKQQEMLEQREKKNKALSAKDLENQNHGRTMNVQMR